MSDLQKISLGRIVLFAFKNADSILVERPATVVRVWDVEKGYVNLQVLTDSTNDCAAPEPGGNGLMWKTSVFPSESGEMEDHRWRWPPRG